MCINTAGGSELGNNTQPPAAAQTGYEAGSTNPIAERMRARPRVVLPVHAQTSHHEDDETVRHRAGLGVEVV